MTVYSSGSGRKSLPERETASQATYISPISSLGTTSEKTANEHIESKTYRFSPVAKTVYYEYIEQKLNVKDNEKHSKLQENSLKVILNLHVLLHRLKCTLALDNSVTPLTIEEETLQRGLALYDGLLRYSAITQASIQVSRSVQVCLGVGTDNIRRKIFEISGPIVLSKTVYTSFSSRVRPSGDTVNEIFCEMEEQELGKVMHQRSSTIFFKTRPSVISDEALNIIDMNRDVYINQYVSRDERLPIDRLRVLADVNPDKDLILQEAGLLELPPPENE